MKIVDCSCAGLSGSPQGQLSVLQIADYSLSGSAGNDAAFLDIRFLIRFISMSLLLN